MSYQRREYRPDGTYWVSLFRDDDARTVTTYDETGAVTSTRPYTEAENAAVDAAVADAAQLTALTARVARIEAHLWPAADDPTTPDDPTVADWVALGGIWPDQGLLREGGTVWRNVSGVPLTTPPSGFPGQPGQWGHLFVAVLEPDPEPEPGDEWPAWKTWDGNNASLYQVGAQVTHNGRRWTSTAADNHWEPGVFGWTDAGPA